MQNQHDSLLLQVGTYISVVRPHLQSILSHGTCTVPTDCCSLVLYRLRWRPYHSTYMVDQRPHHTPCTLFTGEKHLTEVHSEIESGDEGMGAAAGNHSGHFAPGTKPIPRASSGAPSLGPAGSLQGATSGTGGLPPPSAAQDIAARFRWVH